MGIQPEHPEFLAPSQLCVPTIEFLELVIKQGFLILRAKPKKNTKDLLDTLVLQTFTKQLLYGYV